MNERPTEILTPAGRLVSGDCFKPQTKDNEGRPLTIKSGPNAGQPRVSYYMGLAIPKSDPGWAVVHATIVTEAKKCFPSLFDAAGNCLNPNFAFKVTDGDSQTPNTKGIKPCDREGWPGNWILHFSNGFAPAVFSTGGGEQIVDPDRVKRGYYVRIHGTVKGNNSMQQPGMYLNQDMVEFIGYGQEIHSGPDGKEVFGASAAPLPAGASATPLASQTPLQAPGAPMTTPPPVNQPGTPPPVPPVTPAPDFAMPPAPPVEKTYNVNGAQFTRAQLLASNWTEQQIDGLGQ